ncbi:ferritin-like domain-containing protein [Kandleria vitulina]|nr:ferritin-like domain-containing protein [Kandleria vitulina]
MEEYYNMINAQIDDVAEVMLMNGYHPVATLEEFKNNSSIKEAKGEFNTDVKAVYTELCNDFHYLLEAVVSIKEAADEVSSYQISSLMDEYISAYKKVIWMIEQTMM